MAFDKAEELYQAARNAKADLDKASTKEEIVKAYKKHIAIGYKSLGRLLVGQSAEEAVRKWASRLGK